MSNNTTRKLKRYFIPTEKNDYKPSVLQRGAMFSMLFLVVLTFTASNIYALLWQQSSWLVGAVLPAVVVQETNRERGGVALVALQRSAVLDRAAQLKADDMATRGYFAHYSPQGVSPWHWFAEANYSYVHAGENLAVHFSDSKEVVKAWMNSPTHRANIVNGNYREIGVGTAKARYDGYDTVFVVQLFGTPGKVAGSGASVVNAPIAVVPEPRTEVIGQLAGVNPNPPVAVAVVRVLS